MRDAGVYVTPQMLETLGVLWPAVDVHIKTVRAVRSDTAKYTRAV
jgi:hypothetical protein